MPRLVGYCPAPNVVSARRAQHCAGHPAAVRPAEPMVHCTLSEHRGFDERRHRLRMSRRPGQSRFEQGVARLLPNEAWQAELRRDYDKMQIMMYPEGSHPTFDTILLELAGLIRAIRSMDA